MYKYFTIALLLFSCAENTQQLCVESDTDDSVLAVTDSVLTEPVTDSLIAETPDSVLMKITYSTSYCGGAYPPDEILEEHRTPQRFKHFTFLLRGDKDQEFTTNEQGKATLSLAPGSYQLFLLKENKERYAPFDLSCDAYYQEAWAKFDVNPNKTDYKIHLDFPCDLCDPEVRVRP
ncbi:MAG: hypothetical protein IPM74_15235 [Crocinitomicaceae bacterium]|nr:hypothetical protein [Crocinitomicaceae bacterium]